MSGQAKQTHVTFLAKFFFAAFLPGWCFDANNSSLLISLGVFRRERKQPQAANRAVLAHDFPPEKKVNRTGQAGNR
jgi:hypothetical protein